MTSSVLLFGIAVESSLLAAVGTSVGNTVGLTLGCFVLGVTVGDEEEVTLNGELGAAVGVVVVGRLVGKAVGIFVCEGSLVGVALG